MVKSVVAHKLITGNSFWLISKKSAFGIINDIEEMFIPLIPGEFKTIVSRSGLNLLGYEIKINNIRKNIPLEQGILFTNNRITNRFWGIGNIEKARIMLEGEVNSEVFNREFMGNKAAPSLIITDESNRTPEDIDRTNLMLKQKFQRANNAGKIMYMSGQGIDVKTVNVSQKDMQFLEQKNFNRETILPLFGVVPDAVGLTENSNKAVSATQLRLFLSNVNDDLTQLENFFNSQFVHRLDMNVNFRFEKHFVGDAEQLEIMINNGMITPKEASNRLGIKSEENEEERNKFYIKNKVIPIEDSGYQSTNEP